jgi:TPR repeat protein
MGKKTISSSGLFGKVDKVEFDGSFVYITKKNSSATVTFPLKDISVLSKTLRRVNNRPYWEMQYSINGATDTVTFRDNTTLWNRDFPEFLNLLKEVNPSCVQSQLSWSNVKLHKKWIILGVLVAFLIPIYFLNMLKGDAYDLSLSAIEINSEVIELVGQPIRSSFFVMGSINTSGPDRKASLEYSITGPNGEADAYVSASKKLGNWILNEVVVHNKEHDRRVQVVAPTQIDSGELSGNEQGVLQDENQAVLWYRKAAEQGDAEAQFELGFIYANGQGVPKDDKLALTWYSKAAEQGHKTAQNNLGAMYHNGQGVPRDYEQAIAWYRKAADQGEAIAQFNLGYLYVNGQGVPQDAKQAAEWYQKAAEQGNASAQVKIGLMYNNGYGVPQDHQEAVAWYRKAAEQGEAAAQNNLGTLYNDGQGVPQDYEQAVAWYRKAAEQNYAIAQFNLGRMYADGLGLPQDEKQAFVWYRKAAEQGDTVAQNHLAWLYLNGIGVERNNVECYAWSSIAAASGDESGKENRDTCAGELSPEALKNVQEKVAEYRGKYSNN